jgi:CRISPR-associated protein Csd1
MIIQALARYYQRKVQNGDDGVAPLGFEYKKIPYVLVLRPDGTPVQIQINKDADGKPARPFSVPQNCGRSGKRIEANLLWDNFEYALGFPNDKETTRKHEAFRARLAELGDLPILAWNAVRQFVAFSYEEKKTFLQKVPGWAEASKTPNNITFKLKGSSSIVAELPEVKQAIEREVGAADAELGRCMITNELVPIARKHLPQIKIRGGQSSGATLVSYNENAFCSFGKKQGANAPVGEKLVFEYATALNALLATPDNRFYLGAFAGVRAGVTGLIIITACKMVKKGASGIVEAALIAIFFLLALFKLPPAIIIVSGMIFGIVYTMMIRQRLIRKGAEK